MQRSCWPWAQGSSLGHHLQLLQSPLCLAPCLLGCTCSGASSQTRGAECGPTSGWAVSVFLYALEITGQCPQGTEITKIQSGGHHVNYHPLMVFFPHSPFIALCSVVPKLICLYGFRDDVSLQKCFFHRFGLAPFHGQ